MRGRKRTPAGGVQAEKQQRYSELIAQGINNSEACRLVGINRKTGNPPHNDRYRPYYDRVIYCDVSWLFHRRTGASPSRRTHAAFRASWELPESEHWRSSAATARAVWAERPQEAIPVLLDAFDRSIEAGDLGGVREWGETCCKALSAQEDWSAVVEVAQRATKLLGPLQEADARLAKSRTTTRKGPKPKASMAL